MAESRQNLHEATVTTDAVDYLPGWTGTTTTEASRVGPVSLAKTAAAGADSLTAIDPEDGLKVLGVQDDGTPVGVNVDPAAIAAAAGNPNAVTVNYPDGADQTEAVQAAIDALPANGGKVVVSFGTKFSLRDLVFPSGASRTNLVYRFDDELNQDGPPTTGLATNEVVEFVANANSDGIVNERRLSSTFHPAWVVDVRKDIDAQDGSLGVGQARTDPARAGYALADERLIQMEWLYTRYLEQSGFNSIAFRPYLHFWEISGIGTNSFASDPTAGTIITGTTSGAKGMVLSTTTTTMTLLWVTGSFEVGETVSDDNETTTDTISAATYSQSAGYDFMTCLENGYWGIGAALHRAIVPWTVAGGMAVAPTRTMGQYLPHSAWTVPRLLFLAGAEDNPLVGCEIQRNSSNGYLYKAKLGETSARAHLDAVTTHGNVYSNAAYNTVRSFNISSVTRVQAGEFQVTFATPYTYDDYTVTVGTEHPTDYVYVSQRTTSTVSFKCVGTGGSTLKDMTGGFFHFAIFGGAPA